MTAPVAVGGSDQKQVSSENESPLEVQWSEEEERVPLKQRLKMLRAKGVSEGREKVFISAMRRVDVVKKGDDRRGSLGFHSDYNGSEARSDSVSCKQSQHGIARAIESSSQQGRMLSNRLDVEHTNAKDDPVAQLRNCQDVRHSADESENPEAFLDDLDNMSLIERQKMLLSRKPVASVGPAIEHKSSNHTTSRDMLLKNDGIKSGSSNTCGIRSFKKSGRLYGGIATASVKKCVQGTILSEPGNHKNVRGQTARNSAFPPLPNVKVEPSYSELGIPKKDTLGSLISVKSEVNSAEIYEDIIDHMMLGDRMKLLASRNFPKAVLNEKSESSRSVPSGFNRRSTLSESSKPLRMRQPCKRKKTVTDSVETALEEDAPGLLQVLIEKGVLVDEIKLYGETEGDDTLDESLVEESFSELEEVISKIFSQRQPFLKFALVRCSKGQKPSYCLACLISLVEQARYLRFRKWPVEWGWCRDLQSFIFVFEKHNRIVLERPEYGYATYFFELVDTLPIQWQIKRLVTSMKLTSCSRITLIENKALTVGDDLTEGEARVLMEYGWTPNSGLGTMLNYCDRVVHDRKNENESSEWRSKIGKLLTDGYNGGTLVLKDIPKKLLESGFGHYSRIKSEE